MRTVLIVDDEQSQLDYLKKVMQAKGLNPLTAISAETAIDLYREHSPDYVLLDLHMPKMSGLEVFAEMKKINHKPKVYIITADTRIDCKQQAKELGVSGYISKPLTATELFKLAEEFVMGGE